MSSDKLETAAAGWRACLSGEVNRSKCVCVCIGACSVCVCVCMYVMCVCVCVCVCERGSVREVCVYVYSVYVGGLREREREGVFECLCV